MARLYADEQFPLPVVERLRNLGHDVLRVQEAGKAGLKIPDEQVLAFATSENRAVITLNRTDFIQLHRSRSQHSGIIVCRDDRDWDGLANRIHAIISPLESLQGQLIRVNRSPT